MNVDRVSAIIRYSQDTGKGAWKVLEVGAEGTVDVILAVPAVSHHRRRISICHRDVNLLLYSWKKLYQRCLSRGGGGTLCEYSGQL